VRVLFSILDALRVIIVGIQSQYDFFCYVFNVYSVDMEDGVIGISIAAAAVGVVASGVAALVLKRR
jgi:hypothetical protein